MTYAPTVKVTPNPVDKMFGFVRRKDVERAARLARQDFYKSNADNYAADQAELVGFVKEEAARHASRPSQQGPQGQPPVKPAPLA